MAFDVPHDDDADRTEPHEEVGDPPPDIIEEADEESFPASDAPARTVVTGIVDQPLARRD
jgi:hypothetical protein